MMSHKPLTIGVVGLWHLGSVYSAALAELGHHAVGFDSDASVVEKLKEGILPVSEEGLSELTLKNIKAGKLNFTNTLSEAASSDIVWVTVDTPCDKEGRPDVSTIQALVVALAPHL